METRKLRMLTESGRLEALLESLVRSLDFLPDSAERIEDPDILPAALKALALEAHDAKSWCAWRDGERLWFYAAEMSLGQSRERGKAVIRVTNYTPDGDIIESVWWARGEKWSQLY